MTVNQIGRLTSVGNGSMRIFNSYDALGRTTQTVHKLDGTNYVTLTRYGYPQNPSTPGPGTAVSFQSLPDFERLDYTYDAGGAQQSTKTTPRNGSQQTIVSAVLRNARGQTIAATYGNGAISIHKYNETTNLRLNQIQTAVGGTLTLIGGELQISGGTTLQNYGYSFDNNGNVTGMTDNLTSTLSATYEYDSLDQLTSMTPAGQLRLPYNYDNLGNLTNKENVTQTYGGAGRGPHALATSNGVTYNYDANGNLIETRDSSNRVITAITWNAENMPINVVQSGITIYQKFFLGEMLWKKVEPNVTTYYLPSMRVENGLFRKFFGGFAERSPDGTLKFYHNDHLGSASLVTNASGNLISRQAYMPYGEDRFIDPSGTFTPKYQFNFKEKESTGFYDYGARLYNPATGRWLSPDNDTFDGDNRYTYVTNNPLKLTDPSGHGSQKPDDPIVVYDVGELATMEVNASVQETRARFGLRPNRIFVTVAPSIGPPGSGVFGPGAAPGSIIVSERVRDPNVGFFKRLWADAIADEETGYQTIFLEEENNPEAINKMSESRQGWRKLGEAAGDFIVESGTRADKKAAEYEGGGEVHGLKRYEPLAPGNHWTAPMPPGNSRRAPVAQPNIGPYFRRYQPPRYFRRYNPQRP